MVYIASLNPLEDLNSLSRAELLVLVAQLLRMVGKLEATPSIELFPYLSNTRVPDAFIDYQRSFSMGSGLRGIPEYVPRLA